MTVRLNDRKQKQYVGDRVAMQLTMHLLARGSVGSSDGESEDHVGAGAVLIGGSGTDCPLPHGTCQQVSYPAWPPHVHTLQKADRGHSLIIVRHLQVSTACLTGS